MGTNGQKHERERQAALNQALRREVNERRTQGGEEAEVVRFVCECSDPACDELVSLTIDEYEFIRRIPIRLVVRPGHVHRESERVLMEEPGRFPCCREVRAGRGSDCAPRPPRPDAQTNPPLSRPGRSRHRHSAATVIPSRRDPRHMRERVVVPPKRDSHPLREADESGWARQYLDPRCHQDSAYTRSAAAGNLSRTRESRSCHCSPIYPRRTSGATSPELRVRRRSGM